MKETIIELINEFNEFFDAESEYGIGYLDALTEICQRQDIPHTRTQDNLIIESDNNYVITKREVVL